MDRRTAKELLHIREWLERSDEICARGELAYAEDPLLQEAGDSLMMKLGEASGRLSRQGVSPPTGVVWTDAVANRNWLIHQYDQIDRDLTWVTLARDLTAWRTALAPLFHDAQRALELLATGESGASRRDSDPGGSSPGVD